MDDMAETTKTTTTKETTDSSPVTEPKIVAMVNQNNSDGIFYYGGTRDVSPNYAPPFVPTRIPNTDVGGYADIDDARGNRIERFDGFGRAGSGWYKERTTGGSSILKFAAIGMAAYLIFK